ncbi:hypothetical protein LCGC14_0244690 [marine sediment metagenome]|uniref:KH domain-containing protein n=1 Tax=marine sediment metagenome TaxID=412755 RepID=A0A0F9UMZ1_9ZZZZ
MGRHAADILVELLLAMVMALVDNEEAIHIAHTEAAGDPDKGIGPTFLFVVDVDKDDVGKLIGRSGKTAGALRHILGASSRKLGVRSILNIPDKKGE